MNELDERISAALHAAVDGLHEQDLRPAAPPVAEPGGRRHIRWIAPLLTAAAVAAAIGTTFALTSSPSASNRPQHQPGGSPPSPSPTQTYVLSGGASTVASPPPDSTTALATPTPNFAGNEPLWPFAGMAQAAHWEFVDGPDGHSPWHADARATALFFVTGYLRFTDITEVTSADIRADRADVGVGYDLPGGQKQTAAVIHLARYGDAEAPWEVIGASATELTITDPAPGTEGSPTGPLRVAGRITGVDENITVALHTLDGADRSAPPVPAGGENQPWSVSVANPPSGVTTVVASTGGGLTAHGRFAVVGIKIGG